MARKRGVVVVCGRVVMGATLGPSPPAAATRPRAPIDKPVAVTAHAVAMEGAKWALPAGGSNATTTGAEVAVVPGAEVVAMINTSAGAHASART